MKPRRLRADDAGRKKVPLLTVSAGVSILFIRDCTPSKKNFSVFVLLRQGRFEVIQSAMEPRGACNLKIL